MKSIDPKTKNSADPSQPNFLYSRVKKKKKKNNKDPRAQNISSFPGKICTLHPCTRNAVPSLPSTFIIYIYIYIYSRWSRCRVRQASLILFNRPVRDPSFFLSNNCVA